jgi:hypothetical protein
MQAHTTRVLEAGAAAYGADADHVARDLLIGLLLRDAVSVADVHLAIERGLARYAARRRRLQEGLPAESVPRAPGRLRQRPPGRGRRPFGDGDVTRR